MSIIEGAPWTCDKHDFKTSVLEEWNDHCYGNPEHLEFGSTPCTSCKTIVEFEGLPFAKLGPDGTKNISLKCEDCESKEMGSVKRSIKK